MKTFNNYINGKEVAAKDGRTTPVIDPVTGKQYATAALSGPAWPLTTQWSSSCRSLSTI